MNELLEILLDLQFEQYKAWAFLRKPFTYEETEYFTFSIARLDHMINDSEKYHALLGANNKVVKHNLELTKAMIKIEQLEKELKFYKEVADERLQVIEKYERKLK